MGLSGRPAERSVHESPPSVVTHTWPPPKSPPKTAITVFESPGSTAMPRPDIGAASGGVRFAHVAPPSVERMILTGCEPLASAMPAQIIEESDGSSATSNTWSLAPIPRFSVTQLRPPSVLSRTLSWVPRKAVPSVANSVSKTLMPSRDCISDHVVPSSLER